MQGRVKYRYRSLSDTISKMYLQAQRSVAYAKRWIPSNIETPSELFWILKHNTTYKHDPANIELLQKMPSLFEDNYWGYDKSGYGDCDCFSITALACCAVLDIPCRLVIVGNSKDAPTHVYCEVLDKGKWIPFDLVAPSYGVTRNYRYNQSLPIKQLIVY